MKRTRPVRSRADGSARRKGDPLRGSDPLRSGDPGRRSPELRIEPRPAEAPEPHPVDASAPRPIRPSESRPFPTSPFLSPGDPPLRSDQESLHMAVRRIAERSAARPGGGHHHTGTGLAGWFRRQLRKLSLFPRN